MIEDEGTPLEGKGKKDRLVVDAEDVKAGGFIDSVREAFKEVKALFGISPENDVK